MLNTEQYQVKLGKCDDGSFGFTQTDGIIEMIDEDSEAGGSILEVGDRIISINNEKAIEHVEAQKLINRSEDFVDLLMLESPKYHFIHSE